MAGNTGKGRPETPISISATSSSSEEDSVAINEGCYQILHQPAHKQVSRSNSSQLPSIDPFILTELEEQATGAAKSLAWMTKYLVHKLSEMSVTTEQTAKTYSEAVQKASGQADDNIRMMYGLMAKCEELNRKMKPVYEIQSQVEIIKKKLDILESICK